MKRYKILIWHVHGSYLYYLTQAPHEFYVPFKPDRKADYIGRFGHIPWGDNLHDVPVGEIKNLDLDCILFQLPHQYLRDQYEILSKEQLKLPKIYLQHDPPDHPTDSKHLVDDPNVLLIHVTHYNKLMWDSGASPTMVINHGVKIPPQISYSGEIEKGLVVINHLKERGRKLGKDIYEDVLNHVPLDLVGMGAEEMPGGIGEVIHKHLFEFEAKYRFFFNPIRYSSFPLALCEAMAIGLPPVVLATTEMPMAIENDVSGYVDTDIDVLVQRMKELLADPSKAKRLGQGARGYAEAHFNIRRFISDWNQAFDFAVGAERFETMSTEEHHENSTH